MSIQTFSEEIDCMKKIHVGNPYEEIYYLYLSNNLKRIFLESSFRMQPVSEFDYIIPIAEYYGRKFKWNGYWYDTLGFYTSLYNPSKIEFRDYGNPKSKLVKLLNAVAKCDLGTRKIKITYTFFDIEKQQEIEVTPPIYLFDSDFEAKTVDAIYAALNW